MSAPLSEQQLADIAARVGAATEGPWCTDSWEIYQGAEYVAGAMWIGETCRGGTTTLEQDRADAAFVAAARQDVPALLAEVKRQAAQIERRRLRLIHMQNDLLDTRGVLSPNGGSRKVPPEIEIHERVTPAVEWLVNRVAELERQLTTAQAERDIEIVRWLGKQAREYRSTGSTQHTWQAEAIELMASKIARGVVEGGERP